MDSYSLLEDHGLYINSSGDNLWWTRILHDNAYEYVCNNEKKFPIVIPSYNSPNPVSVRGFLSSMDEDCNYPIFIFVRDSQYEEYVASNNNKYVTIIGAPDSLIKGAGNARRYIMKWLNANSYSHAFMFDDDVLGIGMTERGYTAKGEPKSGAIKGTEIARVLASWQVAMESAEKMYDNLVLTGGYPIGFSWKPEYCWCDQSALLYRGNLNQVVCLNVEKLLDKGIIYQDNKVCGHEDIHLLIEILENKLMVATLPFIWYSVEPMNCSTFGEFGSTMQERFKAQQKIMYDNWGNTEWVTFRSKRDLSQVVINFRKYRKMLGIEDYVINIWKEISRKIGV